MRVNGRPLRRRHHAPQEALHLIPESDLAELGAAVEEYERKQRQG
jgi:hypothetical protein